MIFLQVKTHMHVRRLAHKVLLIKKNVNIIDKMLKAEFKGKCDPFSSAL